MEKDDFTTFFKKRLSELIGALYGDSRGSAVKFAESLETSPGHVRDWLGESRASLPSASYLGRIYDSHGVNLNWLVPGDQAQPMFRTPLQAASEPSNQPAYPILGEHVQQAYLLLKEGLGRHKLPEKTEGFLIGEFAEGIAAGRSREFLLRKLSSIVEAVVQQRRPHRK